MGRRPGDTPGLPSAPPPPGTTAALPPRDAAGTSRAAAIADAAARRGRRSLPLLLAGLCLAAAPARALETLRIQLPLLDTSFVLKVSELSSRQRLWSGSSDLAELDRASNGQIGRRLQELLQAPLPLTVRSLVERSMGTPLFAQVMLLVSSLVQIEGMAPDTDGRQLSAALDRLPAGTPLTLLSLLQVLPGQSASINLERAVLAVQRLLNQQRQGEALVERLPAVSQDPALSRLGPLPLQSRVLSLAVPHRPEPLQLQLVAPTQGGNGRLVVISHGLWDGPESFLDWADLLASRGYSVILPFHPGSDRQQQQAMLSGQAPPPSPLELRQRPLDISAVLDAVAAGRLSALAGVSSDRVVVIGHSWGATTALQLGGTTPSAIRLRQRCNDLTDPERNLSWVLQCSFVSDADRAALADRRVIAVAAVSPPLNLLFDVGAAGTMKARGLLVSGSEDWVVPSGPEAIDRFAAPHRAGHQLVLVKGGDHFNLRGPRGETRAPLSPLLLAWTEAAFAAGAAAKPALGAAPLLAPVGWGNGTLPLVEASAAAP